MAREINEIQQEILDEISQSESLNMVDVLTENEKASLTSVDSSSKVALWRLFVYVIAVCFWSIEKLFDILKSDVNLLLLEKKPHKASWYRQKVLAFQFGFSLEESDLYNNSGYTALEVENSKVVKYAAVVELNSKLFIKVASESNGERIELNQEQEAALIQYIKLIRDAGVRIQVINRPADNLKLEIDAYYNPLELDEHGSRLDGTDNEPLQNAIKSYLKEFEFNGELVLTKLTDHLQKVPGIKIPVIKQAFAKYGNLPYVEINETYIADAGHMKITEEDLTINWIARDVTL